MWRVGTRSKVSFLSDDSESLSDLGEPLDLCDVFERLRRESRTLSRVSLSFVRSAMNKLPSVLTSVPDLFPRYPRCRYRNHLDSRYLAFRLRFLLPCILHRGR